MKLTHHYIIRIFLLSITLEKAESKEFARWWAVYRNTNEDFSQSISERYADIVDVPFCHWILVDGKRVGGVIMVGNNIGDFFLISPFTDAYTVLRAILPDAEKLVARNILSAHCPVFQMLGFQIKESRHWMIRPTQAYPDVRFEFTRSIPQAEHTDAIAEVMYKAFHGGVGEYGLRDVEAHRNSVTNYFEVIESGSVCHQASSVLFDDDRMVAVCLAQPYKSLPTIRFVVTDPEYQKRGLAKRLMHYAIDTIKAEYEYITLAVTVDNPAHGLYHAMGFQATDATHTLVKSD